MDHDVKVDNPLVSYELHPLRRLTLIFGGIDTRGRLLNDLY